MDEQKPKWEELLNERQLKELHFAQIYAKHFNHGTDGHNRLLLIDFLADALNRVESSGVEIQPLFHPKE